MQRIDWDESMSVGVEEIDNQHRHLLRMFHGLEDAMKAGRGRDELVKLMHGLAQYAIEHFGAEERLMQTTKYTELAAHNAEHRQFIAQILEFNKKHKQGDVLLTVEMMIFLRDWIVTHIRDTDQRYKSHFASAGVK
jgi:hemerythrin-like metal-binding protein